MTRANWFLIIFPLFVNASTIFGQSAQIGIIDFYGSATNETESRKCLPFGENDTLSFLSDSAYLKVKKAIVDCLLGQSMNKQADVTLVCCVDNTQKWIVFVGADTKSKLISQNAKTADIKLSGEIVSDYDSLMNLVMEAIQKGEATENDSSGHSLMTYLPAQQLQRKFIIYANNNLDLLREVLKKSKFKEHREVAATVIAYYNDKRVIIKDLLDAVSDEDENVRNNAVRAIGIIANYAEAHPDLKIEIPAGPFIDMINSISWTDRNKSSFVLLSLTQSRNKELLKQLKERALKPIVDMAKWKSEGHSMIGYTILGRIAGWSDKEINDGAEVNKAASIEKMLSKISN